MTNPGPTPEKRALIDAYETVMKAEAARPAPEVDRDRRPRRRLVHPVIAVLFVMSVVTLAAALALRPPWLRVDRGLSESPAVREATLRFAIGLQAGRIDRYRRSHGSLPATLRAAGASVPDVDYERLAADRYRLVGRKGSLRLTYDSREPVERFVGNAYDVLARRARP